ncbi:MAG: type IV pilin protein [Steroidobacteraceae bacterium]
MTRTPGNPRKRVLTIIKWMVAMVLVTSVVVISIPAHRQYAMRFTRMDAQRDLMELAQRLERCFSRTNNYALADNAQNICVNLPQATPQGAYLISGDIEARTFLLTATPQALQAEDTECGAFTLNQSGKQGITGTGTEESCWSRRRN